MLSHGDEANPTKPLAKSGLGCHSNVKITAVIVQRSLGLG